MTLFTIFKKKPLKLKNIPAEAQILAARNRVDAALDVFAKASDEVTVANLELADLIMAKQAEADRALKVIEDATIHLDLNTKLKIRLDEFRP